MLTTQSLLRTMRATGTIVEYREHHKELSLTEAYSKSSSTFEPASELGEHYDIPYLGETIKDLNKIILKEAK